MCLENAKYSGTLGRTEWGWGDVEADFVAKIKKYQGTFCGGFVCSENSFFFRKYPLKEDKVFSESTCPPPMDILKQDNLESA